MSCLEIVRESNPPPIKEVVLHLTPDQARFVMYCAAPPSTPTSTAATSLYNLINNTEIGKLPVNFNVRF